MRPLVAAGVFGMMLAVAAAAPDGEASAAHWAFTPPVRPALPEVRDTTWSRNPIDRFVLAGLEEAGWSPSPEADPGQLLRRLSLDLTGLPPSPEDLRVFVAESSEPAYRRAVEGLLTSPRHAERMTQEWLDVARYADTTGFAADQPRTMWVWRDWVLRAFAENMPFDRFTIEQMAGDLLPDATEDQHVATGFHRNAMQARGNNPRKEEFRIRGVVDRVDTTARTWLGLSVACAECHDHFYDPLSQREYYQLFAFFDGAPHLGEGYGVHGPRMRVLPPQLREQRRELRAEIEALARELEEAPPPAEDGPSWFVGGHDAADGAPALRAVALGEATPEVAWEDGPFPGTRARRLDGRTGFLVEGGGDLAGAFTASAWVRTRAGTFDLISRYDWRAGERAFVFGVGAEGEREGTAGHPYAWISGERDPFRGAQVYGSQAVNDGRWHHLALVFEPGRTAQLYVDGALDVAGRRDGTPPLRLAEPERALVIGAGYANATSPNAYGFEGLLHRVRLVPGARPPAGFDPRYERLAELRAADAALDERAIEVPVLAELSEPRDTRILIRGDWQTHGDSVQPGVPAVLGPLETIGRATRLDLARWLVDGRNPLVARVTVNRLWQQLFGAGLVRTPDDFGLRGEAPTHPELLDWLAAELVDSGWDLRHVLRLIVTSATYRQSSRASAAALERDPENRLLGRAPRFRLAAEQVRDVALFAAGLLDERVGGPSVMPPQPDGLWEERGQTKDSGNWVESEGADRYRRGLYVYWKRMALYPSLEAFDAPDRQRCSPQRSRTNTPLQALVTLNDPVFVEAARAFAQRVLVEGDGALEWAFEVALSRHPTVDERADLVAFLDGQRRAFQADPDRARALCAAGPAPRPPGLDDAELAAWTMVTQALLNLDEAITRE